MEKENLKGYLEFFSHIPNFTLNAELQNLLEAMDKTQIHTFGWPIGVVIHTDEYKPKPFEKGIRCLINTERHDDYWTLEKNGNFYILKSLWEDSGVFKKNFDPIFFDTRIIRTTEVIKRTALLYDALGVDQNEIMECHIEYGGLQDRILTAANPNRAFTMSPPARKCSVDKISKSFKAPIMDFLNKDKIEDMVYEVIKSITEMCDFFVPSKSAIVDPMVENYLNGKIT